MLKESSTSPHPSTSHPGRRVKHSRGGCVVCKERRLRCSEERPSCARCVGDGRACKYVLRLTWEDESIGRGVKHGRGTQSEVRFADPTPPRDLMQKAQWKHPRKQERYFLNTDARDVEHKPVQPLPALNQITRRSSHLRPQYALSSSELGLSDGMLFQYYQSHICHSLTLVDEASNGYHQIILPMAVAHNSVMSSLLAIGALYLSLNQSPSTDFYAVALRHKQKTLNCLRRDLASLDKISTDRILVSMLLLCLFDITDNCQSSWPTHLTAAENLISIGDTVVREPSLASFVSNFFATRDVMGRTACGAKSKFKEITWHDPLEIDTTIGCSHELMKLISSITDLSRQMAETNYEKDENFFQKLIALEAELDNITQVVPERSQTSPSSSTLLLTQTAELIHGATNVYFYTALHSALPSTQLIRQLVAKQIKLIKRMSVLRSAHLWSIFVTALYVHNDDERIFFLEQFDRLEVVSAAMGPTQAARAVVETVWKRRDLDDETTNYVGSRKISAMSDWNRIVRPMSEGLSLA